MTASRPTALLVGVARRFAAGGLAVCVARRDANKAKALIEEVAASGGTVHAYSVDARQEAAVQELFAKVERDVGPIEVCLYNAGSNVNLPLLETSETLFRKSWELACYGGFLVGREAARTMVPRGRGTILFTGATASVRGGAGFAAFASAKFGLRAVAQSMARELGPRNIHVAHLLIDGGVDSDAIRKRMRARMGDAADSLPANTLIDTKEVAEAYWTLHCQPSNGWSHELDLRTSIERW